ncbi:hypothetical protein GCM10027026_22370 [Myroides odoratimimus subsp. xuanwuensis]
MRRLAAVGLALSLVGGGVATAAEDDAPSARDVTEARGAAQDKARDVAVVRAELVVANQRLERSAIAAAKAAEAWNGARWKAQRARTEARAAERRATSADLAVSRQQESYGSALATTYRMAPELTALGAIADADGIATVVEQTTTMRHAETALDQGYDRFRATATLADLAETSAVEAREEAEDLVDEARTARDDARAAAASAATDAQDVAAEKDLLIAELAELQDISVELAAERQAALEQAALEQASAAAAAAAPAPEAETPAPEAEAPAPQSPAPQSPAPESPASDEPATEVPAQAQAPEPEPAETPAPSAPAPARGAAAAISFARAQLGEPYRWGAAGPSSWDCSGLTMRAWAAGGLSLPHYSVAQYEQSTPIGAADLQAGDLVFWGSSSRSSSIYHVALYVGGGQIIHAPRAGRPVVQESIHYWIPPNFHARP